MEDPTSVVVVGAGVIGLATAHYLGEAGLRVTVADAAGVGEGCSFASGGWLCPAQAGPLPEPGLTWYGMRSLADRSSALYFAPGQFIRMLPWLYRFWRRSNDRDYRTGALALAALGSDTFERVDDLVAGGVAVEVLGRGMVVAGSSPDDVKSALAGLEPMRAAGYQIPASVLSGDQVREIEPSLGPTIRAGFEIREHAWVKSDAYANALAASCRGHGSTIYEHAPVTGIRREGPRVRAVSISGVGAVEADAIVLAAGAWTPTLSRMLGVPLPIQAGKGYSFFVDMPTVPGRSIELTDVHVGVTPIGSSVRIGGTMEFSGLNRAIDADRVATIVRGAEAAFPGMSAPREVWTGPRPITPDGLPIIDRLPGCLNAFVATGHAMLGVSLAASTGRQLADFVVTGRRPSVLDPFQAARFK